MFVLSSGVAGLLSILMQSWSTGVAPVLMALPLALVGFLDDRTPLPVVIRYGVQIATATALLISSSLIRTLPWSQSVLFLAPLVVLLLITVTAIINFTNFMDGLDGLVAGCMAVALSTAALELGAEWPLWTLVGALIG